MVLPPVERTTLLAVRFAPKVDTRLISLVIERLRESGLLLLERSCLADGRTLLRLSTTHEALEEMAERIHYMKMTATDQTVEYFRVQDRHLFSSSNRTRRTHRFRHDNDDDNDSNGNVSTTDEEIDENLDKEGLFSAHEWTLLIMRILNSITVLRGDETTSELSQILDQQYHAIYSYEMDILSDHTTNDEDEDEDGEKQDEDNITTTLLAEQQRRRRKRRLRGGGAAAERQRRSSVTYSYNNKHGRRSACLRHVLEAYKIVDAVIVPHFPKLRNAILQKTWWPWYQLTPPLDEIQKYYGWEISFYFAWMGFLTKWLLFPGITGFFVYLFRRYREDKIDSDEYTPFYGLLTFLWGILFLRFWERHEDRLAYRWGVYSLTPYERAKYFSVRPQFHGFLRKSPITGRMETYYPPLRRRLKYVVSALVTMAMLTVAFTVMICSLNLQGFIDPKSNPRRWNRVNVHPFHIRALSGYAEEGQLFDAKSAWRSMIPVLIHVICMFTMNSTYRLIAEALTEWENHETTTEHRSSLIMKRFLFEAFDCYVGLFYLAFYERNVHRLSMELTAVFQIDTIRRIFLECIVPMLSQRVLHNVAVGRGLARDYTYSSRKTIQPTKQTILEDLEKDEYEQFDDYMEIIIQIGYVTLFASALPLGSLIAIVANWVEIRSDCFKLTYLCRRPDSFRASGLGVWRILMSCVIWTSALTNCLIVGFTSGQLMHYMPDFYIRDSQGVNNFGHEDGWLAVLVIFGLERALLLLGLVVYWAIPSVPEDLADQLERRQFLRMEKISDSMFASTMRFSQMDASVLLGSDDDDDDYNSSRKKDA